MPQLLAQHPRRSLHFHTSGKASALDIILSKKMLKSVGERTYHFLTPNDVLNQSARAARVGRKPLRN